MGRQETQSCWYLLSTTSTNYYKNKKIVRIMKKKMLKRDQRYIKK